MMRNIRGVGNILIAGFFVLMTSIAVLVPSFTVAESIRDYLVHILFVLLILGLIGLIIDNKMILYTGFGCAASLSFFLKSASNTEFKNPAINEEDKIIIAHINLSVVDNTEDILQVIKLRDFDLITFQEYTPDWALILPDLLNEYFPYNRDMVRIDLFGKAIYAKNPITIDTVSFGHAHLPLFIKYLKNDKEYNIVSSYMTPALDSRSRNTAREEMAKLSQDLGSFKKQIIVCGEFNQVYWSHDILTFRKNTGLQNSRRAVNPSSLKMPYDHIFYSSDLECYFFEEIENKQQNHIGCYASFQMKKVKPIVK